MKLISFKHRSDYGEEYYTQVLHTKRWALLQVSVSWSEYAGWPYIQIKSGSGTLLSILCWVYKFGFDIGVCERTWHFEYLREVDVEETIE